MPAITEIVPLLAIVAFWMIIFLFAFVFSVTAMRTPPPAEHDEQEGHEENEEHGDQQGAPVAQDDQVTSTPGH